MLGIGPYGPLGRDRPDLRARLAEAPGSPVDGGVADGRGSSSTWPGPGNGSAGGTGDGPLSERDALTVLATVDGLGPATLGRLLVRHGGAVGVVAAARGDDGRARLRGHGERAREQSSRRRSGGTRQHATADAAPETAIEEVDAWAPGDAVVEGILAAARSADVILARIRDAGLMTVTTVDETYPRRLRGIALPPHVLFVRGSIAALSPARAVAVVGTRRPTDAGRRLAAQLASAIGRCDAVVVSGLAIGIDGAAHAAVVAESRPTVAVLGGGHVPLYPRAHARLADAIVDSGGAVISEFAPDVSPTPGMFPRRNRLITGLADATVVVEAAARSGALTTAAWALEQGRGCFLVPGPLDAPMSAGCLAFLRECPGEARIVAGVAELLEDLGLAASIGPDRARAASSLPAHARPAPASGAAALALLGGVERALAEALIAGHATADQLVAALDLPVATILGALTLLESRGLAVAAYGRYRPAGPLAAMRPGDLRDTPDGALVPAS